MYSNKAKGCRLFFRLYCESRVQCTDWCSCLKMARWLALQPLMTDECQTDTPGVLIFKKTFLIEIIDNKTILLKIFALPKSFKNR